MDKRPISNNTIFGSLGSSRAVAKSFWHFRDLCNIESFSILSVECTDDGRGSLFINYAYSRQVARNEEGRREYGGI